ncbi:hypothetical protein GE061_017148 [Apolygus lucorum]|uniref:SCP domain-containing protein n=1 Tax=Apolygus lucorum TaxID=248454 RepID=A0A8S9XHZ9_APOLU|nr:hypothetical protein GE061_017148 [Apolygus lucorum]
MAKNQSQNNCRGNATLVTTPEDRYILLALHNTFRNHLAAGGVENWPSASNMRQMTWDDHMELVASRWALQCVRGHDLCRKTPEFNYVGQNCGSVGAIGKHLGHELAFYLWAAQRPAAKKSRRKSLIRRFIYDEEYADFAQIVWAETFKVGCGLVHYTDDDFSTVLTVCNYGPAGALHNHQMYREGVPCRECPEGTRCKLTTTYHKLCALPGDPTNEKLPEEFIKRAKKQNSILQGTAISWETIPMILSMSFVLFV